MFIYVHNNWNATFRREFHFAGSVVIKLNLIIALQVNNFYAYGDNIVGCIFRDYNI